METRTGVRFGVVGVGLHGARYLKHIVQDVEEATLVAFTRRDTARGEAEARQLGVAYEPRLESLVARPDVDAIAVVTPPAHHFDACRLALAAGKHVLVEKPMTATLDEALRLRDLAAAAGGRLMLAQTLRFDTVLREVRRRLPELGPITQVRIAQRLEPSSLAWQESHNGAGAGSILLTGVHLFDTVSWLFEDRVAGVYCTSRRVKNAYNEDFFAASVTMEKTGVHADLEISKYTASRSCRIEVVGERGQLLGDYWNNRLFLETGRSQEEQPLAPRTHTVEAAVRTFCRALLGDAPMPIGADDGVRTLEVVEACYVSVAAGGPVACRDALATV